MIEAGREFFVKVSYSLHGEGTAGKQKIVVTYKCTEGHGCPILTTVKTGHCRSNHYNHYYRMLLHHNLLKTFGWGPKQKLC